MPVITNLWYINKCMFKYDQSVIAFGGGTGAYTWWSGATLLNNPEKNTAVFGTWDSGGSSGELRVNEGILPPGDYMQCLVAMMEDLQQRQEAILILKDRSNGHPLVNLLGAVSEKNHHGIQKGIEGLTKLFRIKGKILPISLTDIHLCSETKNGKNFLNEDEIDKTKNDPKFSNSDKICRIYFDIKPEINPEVIKQIKLADKIVITPGSPYTSIFPHLLVPELANSILASKAKLVIILNLMTTQGEDHHLKTASDWLSVFQYYLDDFNWIKKTGKSKIDYLIVNNNGLDKEILEIYQNKGQNPIGLDAKVCCKQAPGMKTIVKKIAEYDKNTNLFRHNPQKLAEVVLSI
jgi:uncharacterized cofD-like protein